MVYRILTASNRLIIGAFIHSTYLVRYARIFASLSFKFPFGSKWVSRRNIVHNRTMYDVPQPRHIPYIMMIFK